MQFGKIGQKSSFHPKECIKYQNFFLNVLKTIFIYYNILGKKLKKNFWIFQKSIFLILSFYFWESRVKILTTLSNLILSTWIFIFYFSFHVHNNMFRTKKIAFFDTVLLRNYIFSYKFFQKKTIFFLTKKKQKTVRMKWKIKKKISGR